MEETQQLGASIPKEDSDSHQSLVRSSWGGVRSPPAWNKRRIGLSWKPPTPVETAAAVRTEDENKDKPYPEAKEAAAPEKEAAEEEGQVAAC